MHIKVNYLKQGTLEHSFQLTLNQVNEFAIRKNILTKLKHPKNKSLNL